MHAKRLKNEGAMRWLQERGNEDSWCFVFLRSVLRHCSGESSNG